MWRREGSELPWAVGCCSCEGSRAEEGGREERVLVGDERLPALATAAAAPMPATVSVNQGAPMAKPIGATIGAQFNVNVEQMTGRLRVMLETQLGADKQDDVEAQEAPQKIVMTETAVLHWVSASKSYRWSLPEMPGRQTIAGDPPKQGDQSTDCVCAQPSLMDDLMSKAYSFVGSSTLALWDTPNGDASRKTMDEIAEQTQEDCWRGMKGVSAEQLRQCTSELAAQSAKSGHVHFSPPSHPLCRQTKVVDLPERPGAPKPSPHSDWPLCIRILLLPLEILVLGGIFCLELPLLELWRLVLLAQITALQTGLFRCLCLLCAVLYLCLLAVEYGPGWIFVCLGTCDSFFYYLPWVHVFFSLACSTSACLFPSWAIGYALSFNTRLTLAVLMRIKVPEPVGKRTEVIVRSGWRVPFWTRLPSSTKGFRLGFEFIFHWWFNVEERVQLLAEALSDHMPADACDSAGFPFLWTSAFFAAPDAIRLLLAQGADVNASDTILGLAPLHAACTLRTQIAQQPLSWLVLWLQRRVRRAEATDDKRRMVFTELLAAADIDPCQRDHVLGATPYDLAVERLDLLCLQPKLKWRTLEALLLKTPQGQRAQALHELLLDEASQKARPVVFLRLPDLLFCPHEGSETELRRRRFVLWKELLCPMVREARRRAFSKEEKALTMYAWEASMGPPRARDTARMEYLQEMQDCVEETMDAFAAELDLVRQELLQRPEGWQLCRKDMPLIELNVNGDDLRHDRFLDVRCLGWAMNRDFPQAIQVLHLWGIIPTAESLVRLVREGVHTLVGPKPRPDIFGASADPALFWRGLVALWLIAAHSKAWSAYLHIITAHCGCHEDCGQTHIAPLKGFNRIMEKAAEYIDERELTSWEERLLSPMHVIDILRGTVECSDPAKQLEVEQRLTDALPLVRAKYGHHPYAIVAGGYRDTKLNLLLEQVIPETGFVVRVIVEVQLVLQTYAGVKARMHAIYRVHRGDFGGLCHGQPPLEARAADGGRHRSAAPAQVSIVSKASSSGA